MTTTTQHDAQVVVSADHFEYLVRLADWAAGQGFCQIEGVIDPDEWCYQRWGEVGPADGDGYSAEALASALSTASVPPQALDTGEVARLRAALEQVANQKPERDRPDDYNRGWEAARYTARNIARAALDPQGKDV